MADTQTGGQSQEPGRANRRIGESGPYLLQHAHNAVDGYPCGLYEATLDRAWIAAAEDLAGETIQEVVAAGDAAGGPGEGLGRLTDRLNSPAEQW